MKNGIKKRILSLVLCISMILPMIAQPLPVYSVEAAATETNSNESATFKANVKKQAIFDWWSSFDLAADEGSKPGTVTTVDDTDLGVNDYGMIELVVILSEYYYDEESGEHWYKVEAREGETLPDVLTNNPWILYCTDSDMETGYEPYLAIYESDDVLCFVYSETVETTYDEDGVTVLEETTHYNSYVVSGPAALSNAAVQITKRESDYPVSSLAYTEPTYNTTFSKAFDVSVTKEDGEIWTASDGKLTIRYEAAQFGTDTYQESVDFGAAFLYSNDTVVSAEISDRLGTEASDVVYTENGTVTLVFEHMIPSFELVDLPRSFAKDTITLYDNAFAPKDFQVSELPESVRAVCSFAYEDVAYYWLESEAFFGSAYFIVKAEDVTEPKVAVSEQVLRDSSGKITVSGQLPLGATLSVETVANENALLEELGIDGGFMLDIKILDADGNQWQPSSGDAVRVTMDAGYLAEEIIHFVEDADAVTSGISNSTLEIVNVNEASEAMKLVLNPAITACQTATGSTDECVAVEYIDEFSYDLLNSTFSFETCGFSVYTGVDPTYEGETDSVAITRGATYYITPNSTISLSGGSSTYSSWTCNGENVSLSESRGRTNTLTVGNATVGDTFTVTVGFSTTTFTVVANPTVITFVGNDGTVNGASTYEMECLKGATITLPTATRSGYYFDGWYTAAEGGTLVGVRDEIASVGSGNLVYDYTVTDDVTLYAHWSTTPEVSGYTNVIEFGLINAYYMENFYTVNGTRYESFGKLPKEPNVVDHPIQGDKYAVYRVDDGNGYTMITEGYHFLSGSPSDYIDESIMDSAHLQTTVSGNNETSQGLGDETGELIRQFLKPGAIDEKALIRAWLARLIDYRNNDWFANETITNIEGAFQIDLPDDSSGLTDDHINEFNLVPYVVKRHVNRYGSISTWIIDMVVVPANHYTLSYDLNLPEGFTASGYDAVETYTEGDEATVKAGPGTLTKTVNGQTYTATFQYWTDGNGVRYDAADVIVMYSDKKLTAHWVTDGTDPGNLKVTKKVSSVAGTPIAGAAFTFGYTIDTNNLADGVVISDPAAYEYTYAVYNSAGIQQGGEVKKSLTDDLTNISFTLQDGWYVFFTGLPAGTKVTVTETALPDGYTQVADKETTISSAQTVNVIFTNVYENKVTIHYEVLGPYGCGTVSPESETLGATTGTAQGSTAAASSSVYKFVGWYSNAECTEQLSTNATYVPIKNDDSLWVDGTTYYAKFEYNLTSLKIIKDGVDEYKDIDPNQTFIFNISGNGVNLDVTVHGSDWDVVVDGLTVGATYTITEKTDWSWRYDFASWSVSDSITTTDNTAGNGATITLGATGNEITFTNIRNEDKWLDGDSWCNNLFKD